MWSSFATLNAGQMYLVETPSLPPYMFRSGFAGTVPISQDDDSLTILDDEGKVVFGWKRSGSTHAGDLQDRVTIEDNVTDGTTTIKVTTQFIRNACVVTEGCEAQVNPSTETRVTANMCPERNIESSSTSSIEEQSSASEPGPSSGSRIIFGKDSSGPPEFKRNIDLDSESDNEAEELTSSTLTLMSPVSTPAMVSEQAEAISLNPQHVQIEEMEESENVPQDTDDANIPPHQNPIITEPSITSSSRSTSGTPNSTDANTRPADVNSRFRNRRRQTGNSSNDNPRTFVASRTTIFAGMRPPRRESRHQYQRANFQQRSRNNQRQGSHNLERDRTLRLDTVYDNTVITANGGHIVQQGCGNVRVEGTLQSVTLMGVSNLEIRGNIEEGIVMSGAGTLKVFGNVDGGIDFSGVGQISIEGDVFGDIKVSGMGSLIVQGTHFIGRVLRQGLGNVKIRN